MDKLTIITKINDMMDDLWQGIDQYPRREKFALGQDTKNAFLELDKLIVSAVKKYYKKTTLQQADVALFVLKQFIRIGYKRGYLSTKRYERLSRNVAEIGCMIGGWIKSQNAK